VLFVDAGCEPQPGWLAPLLAHFSDPAVAAVAPRVASRPGPATPPALGAYEAWHSPLDMGERPAPVGPGSAVPYVPTAVLAVRRSALSAAGGFDERLRFGEDVDLVWRLREAGHRVRYEPAAVATHPARRSYPAWASQRFQYGRSAAPLAARHGPAVAPLAVQPWSVAAWALAAIGHPLVGSAVATGTALALARRAGGDPIVAAELRRLAAAGNLRAGGAIATAIRRAWLPPALAAGGLAWRLGGRRTRASLLLTATAVMAGPVLAAARRSTGRTALESGAIGPAGRQPRPVAPAVMAVMGLADDLAYQAGVWDGVIRAHSPAALLPRW
jgi:mycofactocin system glycosyltransferase